MSSTASTSKIREASTDDIPDLRELEQQLIDSERPYDSAIRENDVRYYDLAAMIADPDTCLIVVESGKGIVGSGYAQLRTSNSFHRHDRHCYIGFIFLLPEYRGRSLGRAILDTLRDWGQQQGMRHFQLDVYAANKTAIRAYEKAGFRNFTVKMELVV